MDSRDAVQHIDLFRGIDPADLDAIAAVAEARTYNAGEHLFDHGHPADALFTIVIGMVEISVRGKDLVLVTLGSGQTLGDLVFFERGEHAAAARAREATQVVRVPFAALERLLAERPGFAQTFYRNAATIFAHHLRQMAAERDSPYF